MEPLIFQPSEPFTIGVELEIQLLDPVTLDLTLQAPKLLEKVEPALQGQIKAEFIQSMVEICTPVCQNMTEAADNLSFLGKHLEALASECGCVLFASSLHPYARISDRKISPGTRYSEIMEDLQLAGRRMITQALHVHIGLPDQHTAIQVCDAIRPYLPLFLALTTSSPFFDNEDTGFHSYRSNLFPCLPRTGIPDTLGNWDNFQKLVLILNQATLLNGIKEIWWDVRPHPDFGTIEIRICDLPSNFNQIISMVALIQALVVKLAGSRTHDFPAREIMMHNKWNAARYGLDGTFINAHPGRHFTFRKGTQDLLDSLSPQIKELGTEKYLKPINEIIDHGTSADRQKKLYAQHGDFREMIYTMQREFWK
ncbi:MAG: YbdK family carboxylate-amine ligase [Desulfobulbaceae bacterium]|uniref:Putative glutamate--cysteine ligase 2 n=1 Tax=Candidatus Desulfobia pelagia TaxID=2841692 RepID=A0A8J6NFN8_9BACT|nr:YbdK family carboxylate-amine ligase [Candidatus Desulfobia pelagia]